MTADREAVLTADFLKTFQGCWTPPPSSIWEWASKNVQIGDEGFFDVTRSRYMIPVFNSLKDPTKRQVNVMKGAQIGLTLLSLIYIFYTIVHATGNDNNILHYHPNIANRDTFFKTKFSRFLRNTPAVLSLVGKKRDAITKSPSPKKVDTGSWV